MIQIVIIAPARFYREGLAVALEDANGFGVVATLARPEDFDPEFAVRGRAVVLLDVADLADGLDAVARLRQRSPGLPIIALGVCEHEADIIAYAEIGTAGFLTRNHSIAELVRTVESAANGELHCSPRVAAALSRRVTELSDEFRPGSPHADLLSRREAEVAVLLEQGLSNQEIVRRLCIALPTVKNHVHNILDKLGLRCRAAAAAWARQQRLDHSVLRSTLQEMPGRR
ncbi:LuxR C-terminal-related transcriptional regulator [Saccharopolyspora rosea]|uniref:LuxR C-terminal-related transcriptional regulator n=1 Tax=Saccharopolyspora rosea TaxID=524884 RepID=A0ABW3FNM1_9PSEU|nr:response regulator transcription factor [Saccharopolyspora rosea]